MPSKRSKAPSLLSVSLLTLLALLLPTIQAWTFLWTDSKGSSFVEPGNWDEEALPCKEIDHPKGAYYEFDAESSNVTIYLYSSKDCSGTPGGEFKYRKDGNSSRAIHSYEVIDNEASSSSSSAVPTSTSSSTPTATDTATTTPAPNDEAGSGSDSDSNSISPGAIGGIVAGVVVGAGVIAAIIYLARQRRKESSAPGGYNPNYNSNANTNSGPGPGSGSGPAPGPMYSSQARTQTTGSNMITAPYAQHNHEPHSPTASESYAPQPLAYSPLESAHPGGQGGWPAKSPVYSPEVVSGAPPEYIQNQQQQQRQQQHGQPHVVELDGGAELRELSSSHMVSEIDGRSRGASVYYGDRKV